MVFSSNIFIFAYLPSVLLLYHFIPKQFKNAALFLVSLVFYGWGEPKYLAVMLAVITINYFFGMIIGSGKFISAKKRKFLLILCIVADLGILSYFKYASFIVRNIRALPFAQNIAIPETVLPIGISFYIFQSMSYVIDVFREDMLEQRSIINFGAYISMFPQLIAGPIVRYKDIAEQLVHREESIEKFALGIRIFIIGLAKKVLIANTTGALWKELAYGTGTLSAWVGMIAYSLQIYFDFSGYSDMAVGLGKMLGFEFMQNFNYPYISQSITEFWRRWHISLSTWFKEYVYIPLGGNRKGAKRQILNICAVWCLTGLWHGANWNFVLWGAYYAILLIAEKLFLKKLLSSVPTMIKRIYLLLLVAVGWMLFYFEDMNALVMFLRRLITAVPTGIHEKNLILEYIMVLFIATVAATPVFSKFARRLREKNDKRTLYYVLSVAVPCSLMILSVSALAGGGYNPFIYFRF